MNAGVDIGTNNFAISKFIGEDDVHYKIDLKDKSNIILKIKKIVDVFFTKDDVVKIEGQLTSNPVCYMIQHVLEAILMCNSIQFTTVNARNKYTKLKLIYGFEKVNKKQLESLVNIDISKCKCFVFDDLELKEVPFSGKLDDVIDSMLLRDW